MRETEKRRISRKTIRLTRAEVQIVRERFGVKARPKWFSLNARSLKRCVLRLRSRYTVLWLLSFFLPPSFSYRVDPFLRFPPTLRHLSPPGSRRSNHFILSITDTPTVRRSQYGFRYAVYVCTCEYSRVFSLIRWSLSYVLFYIPSRQCTCLFCKILVVFRYYCSVVFSSLIFKAIVCFLVLFSPNFSVSISMFSRWYSFAVLCWKFHFLSSLPIISATIRTFAKPVNYVIKWLLAN